MKDRIIKCPNCGCEYLLGEILYPNLVLGQPKNIIKNEKGKIEYWEDNDLSLSESYVCDNCNTPFIVNLKLDFDVEIDHKNNFNEDSVTPIYNQDRIKLNEE